MIVTSKNPGVFCSFKRIKKIISSFKGKDIRDIVFYLSINKTKHFNIIKRIFYNAFNNFFSKNTLYRRIFVNHLYATKGSSFKLPFPRAKGRVDYIKRSKVKIFLSLTFVC